ncbi:MAG TPA: hypothetical protein VGF34_01505 [Stellaceae bacterium]
MNEKLFEKMALPVLLNAKGPPEKGAVAASICPLVTGWLIFKLKVSLAVVPMRTSPNCTGLGLSNNDAFAAGASVATAASADAAVSHDFRMFYLRSLSGTQIERTELRSSIHLQLNG